jgi:hypothetical protein
MKVLIAFGKEPKDLTAFLDCVVCMAKAEGISITGAILCPGPGCWNLALIVDHPDAENFTNQLTMALMPAKWELCIDPRLVEGQFITETK